MEVHSRRERRSPALQPVSRPTALPIDDGATADLTIVLNFLAGLHARMRQDGADGVAVIIPQLLNHATNAAARLAAAFRSESACRLNSILTGLRFEMNRAEGRGDPCMDVDYFQLVDAIAIADGLLDRRRRELSRMAVAA